MSAAVDRPGRAEPLAPASPRRRLRAGLLRPWRMPELWLGLGAALTLGVVVRYVLGFSQYVVMPDELGYMKQAVHFATTGTPSLPGDAWFNSYSQLAPLLYAPAYGLFDTPTAFDVSHAIGATAVVSAAVPVYLLARGVTGDRVAACLAAALAIVVPWLGMSATLMTESVSYAACSWAFLAMTRAVRDGGLRADVVAVAAVGLAALARTQLAVLALALVLAVVVHDLAGPGGGPRALWADLRRRPVIVLLALAMAVVVAVPSLRESVAGGYAIVFNGTLGITGESLRFSRELLAYVAVGIGALPLALGLGWVGATLIRRDRDHDHAFATVALVAGAIILLFAGSFSVHQTSGVNDRYAFFLVPLVVVATVALLVDRRRSLVPVLAGAVAAAALVATADLAQAGPSLVSPSQTFHTVLEGRTSQVRSALGLDALTMPQAVAAAVVLAAVVLAVLRLARRRLRLLGLAVAALLLLANAAQTAYTLDRLAATQAQVSDEFVEGRDWLDRLAPGDGSITMLTGTVFDEGATAPTWWDVAFWSKRADRVARIVPGPADGVAFGRTAIYDAERGVLTDLEVPDGLLLQSVEDRRFGLRGSEDLVGRNGLVLRRVATPLELDWTLAAANDQGDLPEGRTSALRVFGDGRARRRTVQLGVIAAPFSVKGYALRLGRGRGARTVDVAPGDPANPRIAVRVPARGAATVHLTAVDRTPGDGKADTGLRIESVTLGP